MPSKVSSQVLVRTRPLRSEIERSTLYLHGAFEEHLRIFVLSTTPRNTSRSMGSNLKNASRLGMIRCKSWECMTFARLSRSPFHSHPLLVLLSYARYRSIAWELPGNIPYEAKTRLINQFTILWSTPAVKCMTSINDVLDDVIQQLAKTHFGRFRVLQDMISCVIDSIVTKVLCRLISSVEV